MRYTHDTWSVDLPNRWQIDENEECVALCDPSGVGAFQVSSYFKEDGDISPDDLLEFSEVDNPEEVDLPFLNGLFKRKIEGGDSFFNWWLCGANQLVYATYVCSKEDEAVEAEERDDIIRSLGSHYAQ